MVPILRKIPHERDFVICDNTPIKDPNLSAKAKGVLVVMLHLPDDWAFTEGGLMQFFSDGKASIRSALSELEGAGYLRREHPQRGDGTFSPWVWTVSEQPLSDFRKVDEPLSDSPVLENRKVDEAASSQVEGEQPLFDLPILENRNLQRKEQQSTSPRKKGEGARFQKPTIAEVAAYVAENGYTIDPQRFIDYYTANGWKVGRTPMKDWKAAVRNWQRRETPPAKAVSSFDRFED